MSNYKHILFDMDGTLVDSEGGIIESLLYTLEVLNYGTLEESEVRKFLGPPLNKSFQDNCNMTEGEAEEAVKIFRSYYQEKGVYNAKLYDGVKEALEDLSKKEILLYIATSKPTVYAQKIAKNLGITEYFRDIVGSNLDNTRSDKAEVIQYILDTYELKEKEKVLMVGDKSHDLIGARKCGIASMGVTYGYGTTKELEQEKPLHIIQNIHELISVKENINEEN